MEILLTLLAIVAILYSIAGFMAWAVIEDNIESVEQCVITVAILGPIVWFVAALTLLSEVLINVTARLERSPVESPEVKEKPSE